MLQLAHKYSRSAGNIRDAFRAEKLPLIRWPNRQPSRWPDELVKKMHDDHVNGMLLKDLERKYKKGDSAIRNAFVDRGYPVINRGNSGCFQKTLVRKTKRELIELAGRQKRVCRPFEITWEWREWSMKKRMWFIRLIRNRLGDHMPDMPFSSNVKPFDYGTPEARNIVKLLNAGLDSRHAVAALPPGSQGLIWDGKLWFWSEKCGYQQGCRWDPVRGRPLLHRVIWEQRHGPLPDDGVVRFLDGNPNNHDPDNLGMFTRNDLCRENQAEHLTKTSRERTDALLRRQYRKGSLVL